MKKRRIEIAVLALLMLFAAADRPALPAAPDLYQVADFAPQRVATARDLGMIAIKLFVTWID